MSQLVADRDDTIGGNGIVGTQARLNIEPSFFASLLRALRTSQDRCLTGVDPSRRVHFRRCTLSPLMGL